MTIQRINPESLPSSLTENELLLVPNQRMRQAILEHYASLQSEHAWRTPNVQAIDIWLRERWRFGAGVGIEPCCNYRLMERAEEILLWETIIDESSAEAPLLNPEDTALEVNRSYQALRQWQLQDPATALADFSGANVRLFRFWCEKFQERCEQYHLISLVDLNHMLRNMTELEQLALPQRIYIVNFSNPPALYEEIFKRLAELGEIIRIETTPTNCSATQSRRAFVDASSEINACASWVAHQLENPGEQHIGVLTEQDLPFRQDLEHALNEQLKHTQNTPVMSSLGSGALTERGIVRDALGFLSLNQEMVQSETVCQLLHSSYIVGHAEEREPRIHLQKFLRRYKPARMPSPEIGQLMQESDANYSCPLIGAALLQNRSLARRLGERSSGDQWAALFRQQLANLGWPGNQLTGEEHEIAEAFLSRLDVLASMSMLADNVPVGVALTQLRTLCLHTSPDSVRNTASQVSVYTLEEAAGLHFDKLWITGFDDQHWPAAANPSAFIPHSLQREWEIPASNSDVQHKAAQAIFSILQASTTDEIICSHHELAEDREYRVSPFAQGFTEIKPQAESVAPDTYSDELELVADSPPIPLQECETPRGGQAILSDQSMCAFRGFATHRLSAEALEPFTEGLNAADRGSALHKALESCFQSIPDSTALSQLSEKNLRPIVAAAANLGVSYLQKRHPHTMTPRFCELEQQRLSNLIQGFISLELERPEFAVLAQEQSQRWQHGALQLTLKIDRIDRLADGSLAIIDYKSGKYTSGVTDWLSERPENMQLPLYLTVASSNLDVPVSALVIAQVNAAEITYKGISATDQVHKKIKPIEEVQKIDCDWHELSQRWQTLVTDTLDAFTAGTLQVDPVKPPGTCRYCNLHSFCRINELQQELGFAEEEEELE